MLVAGTELSNISDQLSVFASITCWQARCVSLLHTWAYFVVFIEEVQHQDLAPELDSRNPSRAFSG